MTRELLENSSHRVMTEQSDIHCNRFNITLLQY